MSTTYVFRVSLVWLALFATTLVADTPKTGFVRERCTYFLGDPGGTLEFVTATNGRLSWALSWQQGWRQGFFVHAG
jgi:hypothetical protein